VVPDAVLIKREYPTSLANATIEKEPYDEEGGTPPLRFVAKPVGQFAKTTENKYDKLFKLRLIKNREMLEATLRSSSDEQKRELMRSDNWISAHGAILDGSFAKDDRIPPEHAKIEIQEMIALRALDYFTDQLEFELTDGENKDGVREFIMQPMVVNNHNGKWDEIVNVPNWPMGSVTIMSAFEGGEWIRMADAMIHLVAIAKTILRAREGAAAYFKGGALFHDTMQLDLPEGDVQERTDGDRFFHYDQMLYLTHVLGLHDVDLCGPGQEYNVLEAARGVMVWCDTIKCEVEDGNKLTWITNTLEEHNERTSPITPLMITKPKWPRNVKQKQTSPDSMETDEAAASADPISTGSPICGAEQSTKRVRTGGQFSAAATADADVAVEQSLIAIKTEDKIFSIKMERQGPMHVENSPVASEDEGEETAPVDTRSSEQNARIEEDKTNCRCEADGILRSALNVRRKSLRDVGMAPAPEIMRPWKPLLNPDHCARAWKIRIRQMAAHHIARHHAGMKIELDDDAAL
jgi:hypothetical protein